MKLNAQLGWPFELSLLTIAFCLPFTNTSRMSSMCKGTLFRPVDDTEMIMSWSLPSRSLFVIMGESEKFSVGIIF